MTSFDVIVIGAGVLGSACAAELSARGATVALVDPGGPNASSVAAGMIAPAMESALDDPPPETVELFKAARAAWPAFATRHGLGLVEDGAEWRGDGAERIAAALTRQGFAFRSTPEGLIAAADARVEAPAALASLGATTTRFVARAAVVEGAPGRWRVGLNDGRRLGGVDLVVAPGVDAAPEGLPNAVVALLDRIQPVRGQIALVRGLALPRAIRTPYGYAVPSNGGALIGASMEVGVRDLAPDLEAARAQVRDVCAALGVEPGTVEVHVGVRGAVADGLPVAGWVEGVGVALAPRRNGWLMAPLVASVVADAVRGAPPGPHAAPLGPDRPALSAPAG